MFVGRLEVMLSGNVFTIAQPAANNVRRELRRLWNSRGQGVRPARFTIRKNAVRFEHDDLKVVTRSPLAERLLDVCVVERNHVVVLFQDGRYVETLGPGLYAFWRGAADAKFV